MSAQIAGTQLNAQTVAQPENLEHAEMSFHGINPGGFVALSMIVVLAIIIWKKVPAAIGAALDRQIASIRTQLEEARQLRADAEALKAEYVGRAGQADAEAKSILDHAHAEAGLILSQAKADAEALVERRGKMAEDKIAAAERAAIAELRARAASAAAAAAAALIAENHDAGNDRAMVDKTIAGLGQHLN